MRDLGPVCIKENAPSVDGTWRRLDKSRDKRIIYGPNPKEKPPNVGEWKTTLSSRPDRANCPLARKGTVRRGDPSTYYPVRERGTAMAGEVAWTT